MTEPIFDHDRLDVYRLSIEYVASGGLEVEASRELKRKIRRIVSMLTRMAMKFDGVNESSVEYAAAIDYEHEHRDAEHEHEREPEPGRAPEGGFANGKSFVRPK